MSKIGVFGGSFNPVHKGHVEIFKYAIKNLKLDKLLVVPNFENPFQKKYQNVDGDHRIKMLELVLPSKCEIVNYEINKRGKSYSYETILQISKKYSGSELFFIIGSDNLKNLHKWKNIELIIEKTKLIVFKRYSNEINKVNLKKFNGWLLSNKIFPFASREFVKGDFQQVEKVVQKYISQNHLYAKEILENITSQIVFRHCINVANLSAQYAKLNNVDPKKAFLGGLFHDVTKDWTNQEHEQFLRKNNIDFQKYKSYQYHSLTGGIWVEKKYQLKDNDIINAVKNHTSLARELTIFDKIVFAADKLCRGRKFDGIQEIRKLILSDFNKGFEILLKKQASVLKLRNKTLSPEIEFLVKNIHN